VSGPLVPPALPLSFREEIAPHVFAALNGGWSVALVGLPGVGVSNLLRFLAEPRVCARYLGPDPHTLPVYLEADRWLVPGALPAAAARALRAAAHAHGWPRAEQAALRHLAEQRGAPAPLTEMLDYVCGQLGRRVALLGDDFDAALRQLPGAALRELRALRDAHKHRLVFVLGLRHEPAQIARGGEAEAGAAKFVELFDTHTYPVRPYSPADARLALERKALGWTPPLTAEEAEGLYRACGGHAKLLIAALAVLEPRRHLPWTNVERALLSDALVIETCRAVWDGLPPAEQFAAWRLAREQGDLLSDADLAGLRLRGLAVGGPPFIFSSLFEAYVSGQPEPESAEGAGPLSRLRDPGAVPRW
jgi:hypothetical protein